MIYAKKTYFKYELPGIHLSKLVAKIITSL